MPCQNFEYPISTLTNKIVIKQFVIQYGTKVYSFFANFEMKLQQADKYTNQSDVQTTAMLNATLKSDDEE